MKLTVVARIGVAIIVVVGISNNIKNIPRNAKGFNNGGLGVKRNELLSELS